MTKHSIFSKTGMAVVVFASALLFSAFISGDNSNAQRFKDAALNLENHSHLGRRVRLLAGMWHPRHGKPFGLTHLLKRVTGNAPLPSICIGSAS